MNTVQLLTKFKHCKYLNKSISAFSKSREKRLVTKTYAFKFCF